MTRCVAVWYVIVGLQYKYICTAVPRKSAVGLGTCAGNGEMIGTLWWGLFLGGSSEAYLHKNEQVKETVLVLRGFRLFVPEVRSEDPIVHRSSFSSQRSFHTCPGRCCSPPLPAPSRAHSHGAAR